MCCAVVQQKAHLSFLAVYVVVDLSWPLREDGASHAGFDVEAVLHGKLLRIVVEPWLHTLGDVQRVALAASIHVHALQKCSSFCLLCLSPWKVSLFQASSFLASI